MTSFGLNWRTGRDSPNKKIREVPPHSPLSGQNPVTFHLQTFVTYHKRWDIPTIMREKAIGFVVSQQEKRTSFYM